VSVLVVEYSMAESLMNIGMIVDQDDEAKVADADFGDCDDCSSGSDRSFETDDVDANSRGDSSSNGHQNSEGARSRRKRRHGSHGSRRHKGGSRHKHKGYQPYPCKDDIEMQLKRKSLELQEKENAAAVVRREGADQQFITFPVAPFNSTQYLMDEHSAHSPASLNKTTSSSVLNNSSSPQDIKINSVPSTPAESNHETTAYEKKDKEFSDYFTTAHAESLQSLPKEELVKHYMNLEEKVAALQKKVAEQQQKHCDSSCSKMAKNLIQVCVCNSLCGSDTHSFSCCREFVDLMNQSSICVAESSLMSTSVVTSSSSADSKVVCAESAS
jgi:hypothetical protein